LALTLDQIRSAGYRSVGQTYRSLNEAKSVGQRTAFLCHSHKDADLVKGIIQLLNDNGWSIYVDWMDASMPATPNRVTASKIKDRIVACDWLLFLATFNSMGSRWCPWEIGYADGKKPIDHIIIIPTQDGVTTRGSEYLQLYRYIDVSRSGRLAAYDPGSTNGVFFENLRF
jgi:hypothetical protein